MFVKRPFEYKTADKKHVTLMPGIEFDMKDVPEFAQKALISGEYLTETETPVLVTTVPPKYEPKKLPLVKADSVKANKTFEIQSNIKTKSDHKQEELINQSIESAEKNITLSDLQETTEVVEQTEIKAEEKLVINPNPKPRPAGKRKK